MKARKLLERKKAKVVTVHPDADISGAAELMMRHSVGGLPVVVPDGTVVGVLAERDVVRAVHERGDRVRRTRVRDVMLPPPICSGDDEHEALMGRMTRSRLRHLVVVDDGQVTGVISVGDLVKYRLEQLETETGVLRDYVAAQRARG